jgi:hypothetical protein
MEVQDAHLFGISAYFISHCTRRNYQFQIVLLKQQIMEDSEKSVHSRVFESIGVSSKSLVCWFFIYIVNFIILRVTLYINKFTLSIERIYCLTEDET